MAGEGGATRPGRQVGDVILLDNCGVEYESTPVGTAAIPGFSSSSRPTSNWAIASRPGSDRPDGRQRAQAEYLSAKTKGESDIGVKLTEAEFKEATLKVKRGRRPKRQTFRGRRRGKATGGCRRRCFGSKRLDTNESFKLRIQELEAQLPPEDFAPHDGVVVGFTRSRARRCSRTSCAHVVNPDLLSSAI